MMLYNTASTSCQPSAEAATVALREYTGLARNISPEAAAGFAASDTVILSGKTLAAGKTAIIAALETHGWHNKPSLTTRELRPGEVQGVDKIRVSHAEMLGLATAGQLLELEEVREGVFYATHADFKPGERAIKDTELNGAFSLRALKPDAKIVVPIPPARYNEQYKVTEWERRIISRAGWQKQYPTDALLNEYIERLHQARPDLDLIQEKALTRDPNTLILVNDDLARTSEEVRQFVETGKPRYQKRGDVAETIRELAAFLDDVLPATAPKA